MSISALRCRIDIDPVSNYNYKALLKVIESKLVSFYVWAALAKRFGPPTCGICWMTESMTWKRGTNMRIILRCLGSICNEEDCVNKTVWIWMILFSSWSYAKLQFFVYHVANAHCSSYLPFSVSPRFLFLFDGPSLRIRPWPSRKNPLMNLMRRFHVVRKSWKHGKFSSDIVTCCLFCGKGLHW